MNERKKKKKRMHAYVFCALDRSAMGSTDPIGHMIIMHCDALRCRLSCIFLLDASCAHARHEEEQQRRRWRRHRWAYDAYEMMLGQVYSVPVRISYLLLCARQPPLCICTCRVRRRVAGQTKSRRASPLSPPSPPEARRQPCRRMDEKTYLGVSRREIN